MHTLSNSEDPDERPHNVKNDLQRNKIVFGITMVHPKFIVPNQSEESINILRINR